MTEIPAPLDTETLDRLRHVRAASAIGLWVGTAFGLFNLGLAQQYMLGWVELLAVLVLVLPAYVLARQQRHPGLAEALMLASAWVIFGALVVLGGVSATGLFWVYTVPFLTFFLTTARTAWASSLGFLGLVAGYLLGVQVLPPGSSVYRYRPEVAVHFVLSLAYYTVVAAAFNHMRLRYEAQLRAQRDAMAQAVHAKAHFLASVSHDLRQPAQAIGLYAGSLALQPLPAIERGLVQGIEASAQVMADMLARFADYARLDAPEDALPVQWQTLDMRTLLAALDGHFAALVRSRGLRWRVRPCDAQVQTDPVMLQRVLMNLVSNALQFTERGGVLVACRRAAQPGWLRIQVRDSGIGIAPAWQTRVFDEFVQVDNPERDRRRGSGLGLSIVARLCARLGIRLTLRSDLGRGSTFELRVPLQPAAAQRPVAL